MEELKTLAKELVKNARDISYQLFMFNSNYFNLLIFQGNKFIVGIDGDYYQIKNFLQNKLDKINAI